MNSVQETNINAIKTVAEALGKINDRAAYVGGAVISLYADDPAADEPRPTRDVDITLEIASFAALTRLQEDLHLRGFQPDIESGISCRFNYEGILVDVMATEKVGWAPANPWFKYGFGHLKKVELGNGIQISILSLPYFIATKFEAYKDRGDDPRTSHDFEDIIYVLDNNLNLVDEILKLPMMCQIILMTN